MQFRQTATPKLIEVALQWLIDINSNLSILSYIDHIVDTLT